MGPIQIHTADAVTRLVLVFVLFCSCIRVTIEEESWWDKGKVELGTMARRKKPTRTETECNKRQSFEFCIQGLGACSCDR